MGATSPLFYTKLWASSHLRTSKNFHEFQALKWEHCKKSETICFTTKTEISLNDTLKNLNSDKNLKSCISVEGKGGVVVAVKREQEISPLWLLGVVGPCWPKGHTARAHALHYRAMVL